MCNETHMSQAVCDGVHHLAPFQSNLNFLHNLMAKTDQSKIFVLRNGKCLNIFSQFSVKFRPDNLFAIVLIL